MAFISTRGGVPPIDLRGALLHGLAPDGGLYMPQVIPKLGPVQLQGLSGRSWAERAAAVMQPLLEDSLESVTLGSLASTALDFPLPLVRLSDDLFILELFRGPTLAFKDVGARFLARLLLHFRKDEDPLTTVLTATSGDTGGAVAHAFHSLPGIRVVVLYPEGKVSVRQERQFSTLGGNVHAVSVQGDFDDCQRLAKEAFHRARVEGAAGSGEHHDLTSANSINVGRFLPQITYYFHLWTELRTHAFNGTKILVSVPSGNFGNLAAGLVALSMGVPDLSFLAATNENDVVPEYLRQGKFEPRASVPTLSTAMDVGNPSNLDRILHLYRGTLEGLRRDLTGRKVTDAETRACIRRTYEENGYVLDPHSAVGLAALQKEMESRPGCVGVVLATAHPAKFAEVVEPLLGFGLPIPPELGRCLQAQRRVVSIPPLMDALREILSLDG